MAEKNVTNQDEHWMRYALGHAKRAMTLAEVPVGAVAVYQGEIIGAGFNRKEVDCNPIAHAEIFALQEAATTLNNWRLLGVTLYCTLEPCPMCAGAMIQARLPRLVYGAKDSKFGADGSVISMLGQGVGFNHQIEVTAGILADESIALLQKFFQLLRHRKM